jgi:hypothetical protein
MLGREIGVGKIICGDDHARLTVNPGALASEVSTVTERSTVSSPAIRRRN